MILWGQISQFSVFMILQLLAGYGKSGVLELEDKEELAAIYMSSGNVDAVSVPRSDHLLGSHLVNAGVISKSELSKIVLASRFQGKREFLGLTLMHCGKVDKEAIADAIKEQAYENTLELSNWVEGTFRFNMPEKAYIFPISPHINVQHLLLETSRRLDEGQRPSRAKPELPGHELCSFCSAGCSAAEKKKYLRDGICLWRNMPVVVRESIYTKNEDTPFPEDLIEEEEDEEIKGLPFL
jgi:hypothetical protein